MSFHNVICYTNSLLSCIHVNVACLLNVMYTLVATCMILGRLECTFLPVLEISGVGVHKGSSVVSLPCHIYGSLSHEIFKLKTESTTNIDESSMSHHCPFSHMIATCPSQPMSGLLL